jgi:hypothetical protein
LSSVGARVEEAQAATKENAETTAELDKRHTAAIDVLKTEVEQLKKDRDELRKKLDENQTRTLNWVLSILGAVIAALIVVLVITALGLKK